MSQSPASRKVAHWASSEFITKFVIVLLVFPVMASVLSVLWIGLDILLTALVPSHLSWKPSLITASVIFGRLIGIVGSFFFCRKIWPKRGAVENTTASKA